MDNVKVISYNFRGLNDNSKREDVFNFLKSLNADIYCLQDCHFTPSMEKRNGIGDAILILAPTTLEEFFFSKLNCLLKFIP